MKTDLLSEAQLAAAADRSREYVRAARKLGLISPIGRLSGSTHVYEPTAIADVQRITIPILHQSGPVFMDVAPRALHVFEGFRQQLTAHS